MRMDQITNDEVEKLEFPGSASNGNNALPTLRKDFSTEWIPAAKFALWYPWTLTRSTGLEV
jgi:hypothetical protein